MKSNPCVSSQRRKCRKAHFSAPSNIKYKLMSATLSKELRQKYGIRSLPVRKDDEVLISRGFFKSTKGKVTEVYRKKNKLYIEKVTKEKRNKAIFKVPIDASNCVLVKLKLTPDRENLIKRKSEGRGKEKGKYTQQDVNK